MPCPPRRAQGRSRQRPESPSAPAPNPRCRLGLGTPQTSVGSIPTIQGTTVLAGHSAPARLRGMQKGTNTCQMQQYAGPELSAGPQHDATLTRNACSRLCRRCMFDPEAHAPAVRVPRPWPPSLEDPRPPPPPARRSRRLGRSRRSPPSALPCSRSQGVRELASGTAGRTQGQPLFITLLHSKLQPAHELSCWRLDTMHARTRVHRGPPHVRLNRCQRCTF